MIRALLAMLLIAGACGGKQVVVTYYLSDMASTPVKWSVDTCDTFFTRGVWTILQYRDSAGAVVKEKKFPNQSFWSVEQ